MKRAFLIGLPLFLLIVLFFTKLQWDKRLSDADNWLSKQSREVTEITIHDWVDPKRIGLTEMQSMQISDRKMIEQTLKALHCSGSLTEAKGQSISDAPDLMGLSVNLYYQHSDKAELEFFENEGHAVLVRIGHGSNGAEFMAMAKLYPDYGPRFIRLIKSLVAEAKQHPKSPKVVVYEEEPGS